MARTKRDLIVEVWESLDCESVGARELSRIQAIVIQEFGSGGAESPASIARTLADEGAVLRHPEVLTLDTEWREQELSSLPDNLNFSSLAEAAASIKKLDAFRRSFAAGADKVKLTRLHDLSLKLKQDALLLARSKSADKNKRLAAREIAQWLTVWLETPDIFEEWLSLRQRSPEFPKRNL
jgi:hypothetical protein